MPFQSIREAFPFIRQVIQDAYKTDVLLFTHPYQDTSLIDRSFRKMLWGSLEHPAVFTEYLAQSPRYRMAVTKSSLGFYNILASVSLEWHHPDFISIGPFCDEPISAAFIHRIISNQRFTPEQSAMAEKFYEILPTADVNDITIMVLHLLCAFLPEYHEVSPEYLNYSEEKHEIIPNRDAFYSFTTSSAEYYAWYLQDFLETLLTGDYKRTSEKLKIFLDANNTLQTTSLYRLKRNLHELNSFCKEKLLTTTVHPYYSLQLADQFAHRIDICSNAEQLCRLPYQIARKYCLLIKNHALPDYSYLTRSIIHYINQHLEEELTLASISLHFRKNASFLSGQFSHETGQSLTSYIHSARIQAAVQYLNTTQLTVAEVASSVGIPNFRYFSRLFKEQTGVTPREYKKMLNK